MTNTVSVALFSTEKLGDALLQMIIANNLARQGFKTTMYSNYANQLGRFVANYNTDVIPDEQKLITEISNHDVVLYDQSAPYLKRLQSGSRDLLRRVAIGFLMASGHPQKTQLTYKQLHKKLGMEKIVYAGKLLCFNRTIRHAPPSFQRDPMAQQIAWFLRQKIGFSDVTDQPGILVPEKGLDKFRFNLAIHPCSASSSKNWGDKNFIQLAGMLEKYGFKPVFTVGPDEVGKWSRLCNGKFQVPSFETVAELADFYRHCAWFIGTDSGNAHLASILGLPTFQIFKRWRKTPGWRAGWGPNHVVTAPFPYSLSKTSWQHGLSVNDVFEKFMDWVHETGRMI